MKLAPPILNLKEEKTRSDQVIKEFKIIGISIKTTYENGNLPKT